MLSLPPDGRAPGRAPLPTGDSGKRRNDCEGRLTGNGGGSLEPWPADLGSARAITPTAADTARRGAGPDRHGAAHPSRLHRLPRQDRSRRVRSLTASPRGPRPGGLLEVIPWPAGFCDEPSAAVGQRPRRDQPVARRKKECCETPSAAREEQPAVDKWESRPVETPPLPKGPDDGSQDDCKTQGDEPDDSFVLEASHSLRLGGSIRRSKL